MEKKEVKEGLRKGLGISQPFISTQEGSGHSVIPGMDKEGGTEEGRGGGRAASLGPVTGLLPPGAKSPPRSWLLVTAW